MVKVNADHMYHGAALTQIAEHPQFTAINAFKYRGSVSRSAFRINDDVGVYLKYASKPTTAYREYVFTFAPGHREELSELDDQCSRVIVALVCVKDRQVCGLSHEEFDRIHQERFDVQGWPDSQFTLLALLPKSKQFRVYANVPGHKGQKLGEVLVPRNAFPSRLFE